MKGEASVLVAGGTTNKRDVDLEPKQSALVLHPRIGNAIPFNETIGLWPRVGISYSRLTHENPYDTVDSQGNPPSTTDRSTLTSTHLTVEGLL